MLTRHKDLIKDALQYYEQEKEKVVRKAVQSRMQLEKLRLPELKDWDTIELEQPTTLFQVVASVQGELLSIYDGSTRYELGRWTLGKHGACSWPPLSSCFYGFQTRAQALAARFPAQSKLLQAPKVLLQFEASGKAYLHQPTGTWAVPGMRPLRILPDPVPAATAAAAPVAACSVEAAERKALPWFP